MNKLTVLSAAALIGLGSVISTGAEAGPRRNAGAAVAAGIFGLAAGAMLGAAASNAYAAPAYVYTPAYGYGYAPAYGYGYAPAYGYGYAPAYGYEYGYAPNASRTTRVVQSYGYGSAYDEAYVPRRTYRTKRVIHRSAPGYRTTRVVRTYDPYTYRSTRVVRSYDPYATSYGGPGVSINFGFSSPGFGYWR